MNKEEKKELLETIMTNPKSIVAYYAYPTGVYGDSIAETDEYHEGQLDTKLKDFVCKMIRLGADAAGARSDNKTAVKIMVYGVGYPIYLSQYDNKYRIVTEINPKDKQAPTLMIVEVNDEK